MSKRNTNPSRFTQVKRLVLAITFVSLVWLVLLPQLASRPQMAKHLQWLEVRRIDPSAMYYTELEAMEPILDRLNKRERAVK